MKSSLLKPAWLERAKQNPLWRLESALIAGALIVGMGSAWLSEANREAANDALMDRFKVQNVVVTTKDLTAGARLDPDTVRSVEILKARVTANFVAPDTLRNVLGRTLLIDVKAGDPVLLTAVEGGASGSQVAAKIPPGKRLVTLQIKDKVAEKGWIKPNDRVDVLANMALPGRGETAFTLLEDVSLVSVGRASVWESGQAKDGTEIGFYASPEDAEFISFADKHGEFSLSLRNPQDVAVIDPNKRALGHDGIDMNKFLDHASINKASGGGELPVFVKGKKEETKDASKSR